MKASRENRALTVTLSDNGIGITEDDQLHLFERFYKTDKARIRHKSGSGLGLAIVKKIIDMHHGTIRVQSKQHEGTTIIIIFDGGSPPLH
jgi:signal transduction histidine kinase